MCRPVVGRTTSQSSWRQRWNDRLRGGETPCQYRAGKVEAALRHRREWVPEMPALAELLCRQLKQKGWDAGSRDGQTNAWPGAGEALPCLGGSLQMSGEKGQLLLPCYGWGTNWVAVKLHRITSEAELAWEQVDLHAWEVAVTIREQYSQGWPKAWN